MVNQRPAFLVATNRLKAEGVPLRDVAKLFGVSPGTVTRWRSQSPKERLAPPPTWRASLAVLARDAGASMTDRGATLEALAVELETLDPTEEGLSFRDATALLINRGVSTRAVADILGYKPQTVRAMRSGSRSPPRPKEWVPQLRTLAEREGFADLEKLFLEAAP